MTINETTVYQGVIAAVVLFAIAVVAKIIDQRRDARQAVWQELADAFGKFGQDQFADAFKALARDGYEKFFGIVGAVLDRLRKPGGVAEVLSTMIIKSLRDKDFMEDPVVKPRLDPVLAEISLGFLLDDATQAELGTLAPVLAEYGSVEFQDLFSHLSANRVDKARASFQAIIALLRNKDRLDDELVKRAEKALPRIVKADPAHYATLKRIFDSIPAPATT